MAEPPLPQKIHTQQSSEAKGHYSGHHTNYRICLDHGSFLSKQLIAQLICSSWSGDSEPYIDHGMALWSSLQLPSAEKEGPVKNL